VLAGLRAVLFDPVRMQSAELEQLALTMLLRRQSPRAADAVVEMVGELLDG
jgi:hypothetical protein